MTQEPYRIMSLSDWTRGICGNSLNPMDCPTDGLACGENLEIAAHGLRTRNGSVVASANSLPSGDVVFLKQLRFPTNEVSYTLAQVLYRVGAVAKSSFEVQYHSAIWDTGNGVMLVYMDLDIFIYTPETDTWDSVATTGGPPDTRQRHTAVYDAANERMLMYGGVDIDSTPDVFYTDLWSLDLSVDPHEWTELTTTGDAPTVSINHAMCLNTTDNKLVVIAGQADFASSISGDAFVLDLGTLEWTQVDLSSIAVDPFDPAKNFAAVYSESDNSIYMIAGNNGDADTLAVYKWDMTANEITAVAQLPFVLQSHAACICGDNIFVLGGTSDGTANTTALVYSKMNDTWEQTVIAGLPAGAEWTGHTLTLSEAGMIYLVGTPAGIGDVTDQCTWAISGICGGAALGSGLYVSSDHLPTTTGTFTKIYELGVGAGTVSADMLNDRCVITEGVTQPPLVFPGCMTSDGSDWAAPKAVLVSMDGTNYYDISAYVLDKDPDVSAGIGSLSQWGYIVVICDMPQIEGLYFEMDVANGSGSGNWNRQTFELSLTETGTWEQLDYKETITHWVQDTAETGHFVYQKDFDEALVVDEGGGYCGLLCEGHGLTAGDEIIIFGSTNYNGTTYVNAASTADKIVIAATYVLETLTGAYFRKRVTLGAGNESENVQVGLQVVFSDITLGVIMSITDDGEADNEVELQVAHATGEVDSIVGLVSGTNDYVTVTSSDSELTEVLAHSMTSSYAYAGYSVRQVIPASAISQSGTGSVRISFQTAGTCVVTHVSIVERSGSTANGTTTPTEVTFNNGLSGFTSAEAEIVVSDTITNFAWDETKNYLVIMDVQSGTQTVTYSTLTRIVNPAYTAWVEANPRPYGNWPGVWDAIAVWNALEKPEPYLYVTEYTYATFNVGMLYRIAASYGTYLKKYTYNENYEIQDGQTWNIQSPEGCTYQNYFCIGVAKVEVTIADATVPSMVCAGLSTDTTRFDCSGIDEVAQITVTQSTPGDTAIYHALSFDERVTFQVYKEAAWRSIARNNTGTYEYNDSSTATPNWVAANTNTVEGALQQAFAVAENQMTKDELEALTSTELMSADSIIPTVTNYVDFAFGLQAAGGKVPSLVSYSVGWGDQGSTMLVQGLSAGAWKSVGALTDNTNFEGNPLGQSGTIDFTSPFTADYGVVNEVPGYPVRLKCRGTSAGTSVTRILYKAPCQPLCNIGDGQPDTCMGFIFNDVSADKVLDYTIQVSDNTFTENASAPIPMETTDYLYVGYPTRFNALSIKPYEDNNGNASTLAGEYWNGSAWTQIYIVDGTRGASGKTFSSAGRISWTLPSDWKTNIPFDTSLLRGYWMRFSVSSNLTGTTAIAECRVYPVPDELSKHKFVAVVKDRVALLGRTDAPDQADISRVMEEYGFTGTDSWSYRVGGMDAIQSVVAAWDGLFVGKVESWHQLTGNSPSDFAFQGVEAARHVPINSRVVVKAPAGGFDDGSRAGLFFINRYGAFVATGLQVDSTWNTARSRGLSEGLDWWAESSNTLPRLDLNYLHLACGEYWPVKNWVVWSVPMITETGQTSQTQNNRLMIYDAKNGAWLPPFTLTAASLCTAYHYNAEAPGKLGAIGMYAGDYQGRIVRLFVPNVFDDEDVPVSAWFETGWLTMGDPGFLKLLRMITIYGRTSGSEIDVEFYLDGGDQPAATLVFDKLKGIQVLATERKPLNLKAGIFKIKAACSGFHNIYGLDAAYSLIRNWE